MALRLHRVAQTEADSNGGGCRERVGEAQHVRDPALVEWLRGRGETGINNEVLVRLEQLYRAHHTTSVNLL